MTIVLIQPCRRKQFYKNPYRLQAVYTEVAPLLPQAQFVLWDRDTSQTELPCSGGDILIVDAADADAADVCTALDRLHGNRIYLLDATCDVANTIAQTYPAAVQSGSIADAVSFLTRDNGTDLAVDPQEMKPALLPPAVQKEFASRGIQFFTEGAARGCEGNCTFCRLSEHKRPVHFVPYSTVPVILQAEKLLDSPLFVQFSDENFFGSQAQRSSRVIALAQQLQNAGFSGFLGVDTRLDSLPVFGISNPVSWSEMEKAGLRYCFIGIESFSESQAKRYGKHYTIHQIEQGLRFLNDQKLTYTLGLILWDPMMTPGELVESIDYIEKNGLLGKTASLLKPLRISPDSPYMKIYADRLHRMQQSGSHWDDVAARYSDKTIRRMAQLLFPVYGRFLEAGYRHSDVSLFSVFPEILDSPVYSGIPVRVARFELMCIRKLLPLTGEELAELPDDLFTSECCALAEAILKDLDSVQKQHPAIHAYYSRVFSAVRDGISY